jgi:hypothetical protein
VLRSLTLEVVALQEREEVFWITPKFEVAREPVKPVVDFDSEIPISQLVGEIEKSIPVLPSMLKSSLPYALW